MYRALIKIAISMAVAVGLSLTFVGTAGSATAAPVSAASAASAASDTNPCATQKAKKAKKVKALKKAKKQLKKAKKAHKKPAVKKAKKKVKKAKKAKKVAARALERCKANNSTDVPTNASPIQALCDLDPTGAMQPLCDALAGLIPSGGTDLPIQALCDAVPQAQPLCDAISAGLSDPASALDIIVDTLKGLLDQLGLGALGDLLDGLLGGGLPSFPGLPLNATA